MFKGHPRRPNFFVIVLDLARNLKAPYKGGMEHEPVLKHTPMVDLTSLNVAEVRILELLADGHTAKSIATLTGCSVVSVNERLRQSRRKTGVSSSRELARVLRAQKNGHKKTELASEQKTETKGAGFRAGVIAMSTLLLVAAIGTVYFQTASGVPTIPNHPILNRSEESDPRHTATLVRTEKRDEKWAGRTEAALKERFSALGGRIQINSVMCAHTVCEVFGKINESNRAMIDPTMQKLQDPNFTATNGLSYLGAAFGPDSFAVYLKRSDT